MHAAPGIAPSNVYSCKDGPFMIGANKDSLWKRLAVAMGRPGLDALINAWTGTRCIDEVEALMVAHSIPGGRVYRAPDMLADLAARGVI